MATILDVAKEAGVGVGTVSRVLNDHPRVAPDTRARVTSAIGTLGYRPNPLARGLSNGKSALFSVLVPSMTSPSVVARLRGMVSVFNASDQPLSILNIETAEQKSKALAQLGSFGAPEGVLILSLKLSDEEIEGLRSTGAPVVLVDTRADGLPSFTIDDVEGGRMAAEHVLSLGHRRVAFLGDIVDEQMGFDPSRLREEGFRKAHRDAGISIDTGLIRHGLFGKDSGRTLTLDLLDEAAPPTAFVVASDTQALGVMEACRERGLRIPEDISIVGYDDIDVAEYVGLTTVRQPLELSGRLGAEQLLALANRPDFAVDSVVLDLELVVRSSTGPIPKESNS